MSIVITPADRALAQWFAGAMEGGFDAADHLRSNPPSCTRPSEELLAQRIDQMTAKQFVAHVAAGELSPPYSPTNPKGNS